LFQGAKQHHEQTLARWPGLRRRFAPWNKDRLGNTLRLPIAAGRELFGAESEHAPPIVPYTR
jgi:hypothetical protein